MECLNTTKTLKLIKDKRVGTVIIVVEGQEDEFRLLKHIFTKILNYNYVSMKRGKTVQYEFKNDNSDSTIIVANTKSSTINTILEDKEYKDKLYYLLKDEFNFDFKNASIYFLWDRDKDTNSEDTYLKAINTYYSAQDNEYEMNGLLLVSYPCYESYNLSNFNKNFWKKKYKTSIEAKKEFNKSIHTIKDINEKSILLAVENMHNSFINYNIREYDPSNFLKINKDIFRKEKECYKNNKYFNALSLISIMLVDLGIVCIND